MYDKSILNTVLDEIETFFSKHIKQFEERFIESQTLFEESDNMGEIKNIFKFYDDSIEIEVGIDFETFISLWKTDILMEYDKKNIMIGEFVNKKIGLTNDISTKMIAAEKSFGLSVTLMDDILEYRTNLLNDNLINDDIISYNVEKLNIISKKLTHGFSDDVEEAYFNSEWLIINNIDEETYWSYLKNKMNYIVNLVVEIVDENHLKVDDNMNKIDFIDKSINEMVEIISTCSIMVASSPKKRDILIKSYNVESVKYQIGIIFNTIHSEVEEKFAGKSMKTSLHRINEENNYESVFEDILNDV